MSTWRRLFANVYYEMAVDLSLKACLQMEDWVYDLAHYGEFSVVTRHSGSAMVLISFIWKSNMQITSRVAKSDTRSYPCG